MVKHSYSEIKNMAKDRVNSRFGDALLIFIVPGILVFVITLFTGIVTSIFGDTVQLISDIIIRRVLNMVAMFASTFMIVNYARGRDGFTFDGLFDKPKKLGRFIGYSIFSSIIGLIALIPLSDFIIEMYPTFTSTNDPSAIAAVIRETILENPEILSDIKLALLLLLVFSLIMVKFIFTSYLIVDGNYTVVEAIRKSWVLTKGNYFRILFFPFTFFGWIMLVIITCGLALIYVGPLLETGRTYLYLSILKESDGDKIINGNDEVDTTSSFDEFDPLFE